MHKNLDVKREIEGVESDSATTAHQTHGCDNQTTTKSKTESVSSSGNAAAVAQLLTSEPLWTAPAEAKVEKSVKSKRPAEMTSKRALKFHTQDLKYTGSNSTDEVNNQSRALMGRLYADAARKNRKLRKFNVEFESYAIAYSTR